MVEEYQIVEKKTMKALEDIRHIHSSGKEYWFARELQNVLGYVELRNFMVAIQRAQDSCATFGGSIVNHFVDVTIKVATGSGASRAVPDMVLSRYACYLIAMNGEPTKPEIASAQEYFAVQTRRQELFNQLTEDEKRVAVRDRIKHNYKRLGDAAKQSGVENFGLFNDAGVREMYGGLGISEIKNKKGIPKNEQWLDWIGRIELTENDFRYTQTEAKLIRDKVKGDIPARVTHREVAKGIRSMIHDFGGPMPEDLPRATSIKKLKSSSPKELPSGNNNERE